MALVTHTLVLVFTNSILTVNGTQWTAAYNVSKIHCNCPIICEINFSAAITVVIIWQTGSKHMQLTALLALNKLQTSMGTGVKMVLHPSPDSVMSRL